jgi:N-acetylglucosamine-6-sulfatase
MAARLPLPRLRLEEMWRRRGRGFGGALPPAASALRLAVLTCLLGLGCRGGEPEVASTQAAPRRPNLILIVTDDMSLAELPHLPVVQRRLVEEGVTFTNAFVSTPSCTPSRVSILTGQYAHNHGIQRNDRFEGGFPVFFASGKESSTLATWLQRAGRRTLLLGKYLNWYPRQAPPDYVPPGWSRWEGLYSREDYYGFMLNSDGELHKHGSAPEEYQTDVLRRRLVDHVTRYAGDGGPPFFVYLAPYAPHGPTWPAPRHERTRTDLRAPRSPAFDEADVGDKPEWMRRLPRLSRNAVARVDDLFRRRVETLLSVDELLGELLDVLERTGQLDDTFVLFTSDNGFHQGTHRRERGKSDPYDESIRVPLLLRGPGVPRGRQVDALVANVDLAPTIAELLGVPVPGSVDGRSLVPLLRGPVPVGWRGDLLIESWPNYEDGVPAFAALRSRDRLYVEYESGERELYHLDLDPFQLENRYASARPEEQRLLAVRLAAHRRCFGETCRD